MAVAFLISRLPRHVQAEENLQRLIHPDRDPQVKFQPEVWKAQKLFGM